jgi:hypothetical protein
MNDSSSFVAVSSVAGKLSARKLTAKLRKSAYKNGWPTGISRQLKVTYTGNGNFTVDFPESVLEDILDLEYGTQNTPPNPVIRNSMNNLNDHSHIAELDMALGAFLNGVIK